MNDERGAVAVIVAVSLTVLLGMGALVLDVGSLYVERRELQNGADAAALAIAEDCATRLATCGDSLISAAKYADANARDGLSNIDDVDLDLVDREVTVEASTKTEDGEEVKFGFARMFGIDGKKVAATATATWNAPQKVKALPMTISVDEYTAGAEVLLCFKQNTSPKCADEFGGLKDGPGSFGYTQSTSCLALNDKGTPVEVTDKSVDVDHGNDGPKNLGCTSLNFKPDPATPDELRTILLPVHDKFNGDRYSIVGFAAIEVDGFSFTGAKDEWCWSYDLPDPPCGNERYISGTFVDFIVTDAPMADRTKSVFTGVAVIQLIE